jgi:hypothetical protein
VNSHTTSRFRNALKQLPENIQQNAREAFRIWRQDSAIPAFTSSASIRSSQSIQFESRSDGGPWESSVATTWFWIGSHADYDRLISRL